MAPFFGMPERVPREEPLPQGGGGGWGDDPDEVVQRLNLLPGVKTRGRGWGFGLPAFLAEPLNAIVAQRDLAASGGLMDPATGRTSEEAIKNSLMMSDFIPMAALGANARAAITGARPPEGALFSGAGPTRNSVPGEPEWMSSAGSVADPRAPGAGALEGLAEGNKPGRIATRLPTAVTATEDPLRQALTIGTEDILASPGAAHNIGLLSEYPGLAHLAGKSTEDAAAGYIDQTADNLNFIYDSLNPEIRERSSKWYEGANNVTRAIADRYGLPEESIAGVMAALSPQKDWFQNASLAERLVDFTQEYGAKPMSNAATDWFYRSDKGKKFRDDPDMLRIFEGMQGKPFNEIESDTGKALAARIFDEVNNPRGYRIITPEGEYGDFAKTGKGDDRSIAWGSLNEIGKALKSIESGGDPDILSKLMGTRHKVRNFYNNILDPFGTMGDVTADTHAVAANLLRPLSGNTSEVAHNFGLGLAKQHKPENWRATKNSAVTGASGTYGINADPYRKVASERDILPREVQSITWEAARGLFPDTLKRGPKVSKIDDIWRQYDAGAIGADDARRAIVELSGRFRDPDWAKPGPAGLDPGGGSTYRR